MSLEARGQTAKSGSLQEEDLISFPQFDSSITHDKDDYNNSLIDKIPTDLLSTDVKVDNKKSQDAPDGGYGWFIVVGSFIMLMIIGGIERSEGIFFLQFQDKFHHNAQVSSWPGAIAGSCRLLLAPLATSISNRHSVRTCTMIGSIFMFASVFLSSFTPNFLFLFFSHGLLQGIGRGLLYAPSLNIVNMYFNKRRSLAAGLATSGVSMGSFLLIPLTQLLFDWYGFTGAFLITSAWVLHSAVVAMLYRPLSLHHKFTRCIKNVDEHQVISSDGDRTLSSKPEVKKSESCNLVCGGCLRSFVQTCFPKENHEFVTKKGKKIFHFYLLKDPSFLLFCISILLFTAAYRSAFTFVPALVKSKGYTESEAAFVMSIASIADTFGRIGAGCLFDLAFLKNCRPLFYNAWVFGLAIVSFTLPSVNSYISLCVTTSFYGLFSGTYMAQKSVVIVDIVGLENMTVSFGMVVCVQGIGSMIGPPLSGAFKDFFGSYTEAFYLGGAFMCSAGIILVFSNVFLKMDQCKCRKTVNSGGEN